ncbi:uncharacterized protein LOC132941038 [Metopolophium dirhodum]|uniref:uncharacterized protein LOC132941038 n=1 Tax=Metopolophium dirhodum TaxID=44670 RepID=UPI0029905814|nr:uncharacterized protein LOC132941038 [Metopolophium dirhodum]
MNQAMQSFLLKTVCCILIINVTFCSSCFRSVCKARCYFRHKGFDFGYCEKGICKCAPPVIYVFDGIGRDLSDEYIDNSLVNNNVIQNSIPIPRTSASDASDKNKKNKIWKDIVGKIISKNPFIKEENLKDLKAKIFNNLSDLNNFAKYLRNPLDTALNEMKNNIPRTTKECNDLLNILLQQQKKNGAGNVNSNDSPILNGDPNRLPPQGTTQASPQIVPTPQISPIPQTTPKTEKKLTASSPRNIVPKTIPANSIAGAIPNVQQNSHPNSNKLQLKLKNKQTPNREDNKNDDEILLELSDETYEDEDSNEQSDENIKQNSPVKPRTPNDKAGNNLPVPVKNEKLDDDSSYESGSVSYGSSEEDNANKVVNAVPTSNK